MSLNQPGKVERVVQYFCVKPWQLATFGDFPVCDYAGDPQNLLNPGKKA